MNPNPNADCSLERRYSMRRATKDVPAITKNIEIPSLCNAA
jgi:hypothetical protein